MILLIWISSFVLACPMAYGLRVKHVETSIIRKLNFKLQSSFNSHIFLCFAEDNITITNSTKPFCMVVNLTDTEILIYRYILVVVQYLLPCSIISFVYIQMALKLWGTKTPGNAQDSRDTTLLKNKKKVIKMLVIVVTL